MEIPFENLLTVNLVEVFCSQGVAPFARGDLRLNPNGKPRRGARLVGRLEQFAEPKTLDEASEKCEFVGERARVDVGTGFAVEVPPVAVEHNEEKEKERGDMSEGPVLTDSGGLLVAEAVEAMKVPKVRNVEELADAPQHAQKVVRF